MIKCQICHIEYPSLSNVQSNIIPNNDTLNVCHRCKVSIENVEKVKKYFKYIKDDDLRIKYENLLSSLCSVGKDDYKGNDCVRLLEAPAGRRKHHAYFGGLLSHIVQMIEFAFSIYDMNTAPYKGVLTKEDIVISCFIHDIHKAKNTFKKTGKAGLPFDYVDKNTLLTNDLQSIKIIMDYGIVLTENQMNALVFAEGGWSNYATPNAEMSKLAVLTHMADMFSAQILKK